MSEGCIFGMGNPLLDFLATVDEEYLKKYDLKSNDAILADAKHMPIYDEISQKGKVEYLPGGATLNAVKIAARILGQPNVAGFAGCIADDKYGKLLEDSCAKFGVKTVLQYTSSDEPTGTCAVLISGQDRSLVTSLGAANKFTEDHLDKEEVWSWVKKSKVCYIAAFFATVCPPAIMRVAKHALENGKTFSMNLSAPFLCEFFLDPIKQALPYVDLLFGNETEAQTFAKAMKWDTTDVAEIAKRISDMPLIEGKKSRTVIFTQGPDPVVLIREGKVTTYTVNPLPEADIVDTNGAGDAFVGGFLAQYVLGRSVEDCIRCANIAAREVIKRSGCTFPETFSFE